MSVADLEDRTPAAARADIQASAAAVVPVPQDTPSSDGGAGRGDRPGCNPLFEGEAGLALQAVTATTTLVLRMPLLVCLLRAEFSHGLLCRGVCWTRDGPPLLCGPSDLTL